MSKNNLLKEGKDCSTIYVTGNTAIDALRTTVKADYSHEHLDWADGSRLIMITAHRRENLGVPIHMNPVVRESANEILGNSDRVRIIEPLEVLDFHNFLSKSYLILTDSGGIQEEAPSLGKPILVMRDTTERPEGVTAGTLRFVGTKKEYIYQTFKMLLEDNVLYQQMSRASNLYGDGYASKRKADVLESCNVRKGV
jgi:UDP-N-acetylglucosamine 2-epimerase (non-hydrolysing)